MALLQAIRHHLGRAMDVADVPGCADPDVRAEMRAEDEGLERRLQRVEEKASEALAFAKRVDSLAQARIQALEEKIGVVYSLFERMEADSARGKLAMGSAIEAYKGATAQIGAIVADVAVIRQKLDDLARPFGSTH